MALMPPLDIPPLGISEPKPHFLLAAAAMVAIAIWVVAPRGSVAQSDLQLVFSDDGTAGTWQDKWFLDGPADVHYTADGMAFDASPGSGEAVLWAKPIVRGDVRIEYDYRVRLYAHG